MTVATEASTRDRLVAAAIEVFREHGYERARVSDIARAAGLTTGAIYANYRGKADLLLDAIATQSGEELDSMLRETAALPARQLLEVLGSHLLHHRDGDRPLLLDAIVASRRDPELASRLRDQLGNRRARFAAVVTHARADGAIDTALDPDTFVTFCTTLAFGALVARTLEAPVPDHEEWDALLARLLDAIAPQQARGAPQQARGAPPTREGS